MGRLISTFLSPPVGEFAVAMVIATSMVVIGTTPLRDRASRHCRGTFDQEGNSSESYARTARYLSLMTGAIVGAVKLPSIIVALGKATGLATGSR